MRPILVFGATGQIGWELCRQLGNLAPVLPAGRSAADFMRPDSIRTALRDNRPSLVVNAAAYTQVDNAENEPELATAVNAVAPAIIADEVRRAGIALIHYSTDYIFDGEKKGAYVEDDEPHPLNVYGQTKLAGETAIRRINPSHLILRTSWIYSARGRNFLLTMLRLAAERDELGVVNDQIGAPTWARSIARVTAQLAARAIAEGGGRRVEFGELGGTYHATASGCVSWYDFARAIMEEFAGVVTRPSVRVVPIGSRDYKSPARRPANSCLSNEKLRAATGMQLPDWREDLAQCAGEIRASLQSPPGPLNPV